VLLRDFVIIKKKINLFSMYMAVVNHIICNSLNAPVFRLAAGSQLYKNFIHKHDLKLILKYLPF